jgi:diaminohydroxyphosphoribosylaminopyrimidine deaminase/5-amino-6-(5-phosphoribosylamino)uracil reductase
MRAGSDEELMATASDLAEHARFTTPPNPWVGCVLVRDGEIVGRGATGRFPGGMHAEAAAIRDAGDRARGATAYVTLEPCNHQGHTPPCTDALIGAGVARTVIALVDPDPNVRGTGIERLRAAGIEVECGLGADDVGQSLAPYLHQRATGRAFALLKTAMSLDGRTAAADGSSQWITGIEARADAHRLRSESQAVVVGPGTARADQPRLTVRGLDDVIDRQPLRVLLDAKGRVPAAGPLFDVTLAPTLVVTTEQAPPAAVDAWQAAGAKVETVDVGKNGRGVDLAAVLTLLAQSYGVLQAMIEGGGRLHGALIEEHLADRLVAYVAPTLLGERGLPVIGFPGPDTLTGATRWQLRDVTRFAADVRLTLDPPRERGPEHEVV